MSTKTAIYARQSHVKKGEKKQEKVELQVKRCAALITAKKWEHVETYVDNDTSATKVRGPETKWRAMLADAKAGRIQAVVAVDIDRLLRTSRDLVDLVDLGLVVVTVDGELDLSTADGEYRASQAVNVARFEVRRKAERQKRSNEAKRDAGRILPGRRLYGFTTSKDAKVRIVEEEAVIVREVFQRVADGDSLYSIARDLGEREVPVGTGKVWRTGRLRDMIQNPRYTSTKGVRPPKGVDATKDNRRVVSLKLAEDARAVLADPTRKTTTGPTKKHFLSGVVICGACGRRMVFTRSYHCTRPTAGHPNIKKSILDPIVRRAILGALLLATPADLAPEDDGTAPMVEKLQQNLAAQGDVADLIASGDLNTSVGRSRLVALREVEHDLAQKIETARASSAGAGILSGLARDFLGARPNIADAATALAELEQRFDALTLPQQQELVRGLLRVTVYPGRGPERVEVEHLVVTSLNDVEAAV
jgi:site-specific DNA recombinase